MHVFFLGFILGFVIANAHPEIKEWLMVEFNNAIAASQSSIMGDTPPQISSGQSDPTEEEGPVQDDSNPLAPLLIETETPPQRKETPRFAEGPGVAPLVSPEQAREAENKATLEQLRRWVERLIEG